jgi:hypothetical protein
MMRTCRPWSTNSGNGGLSLGRSPQRFERGVDLAEKSCRIGDDKRQLGENPVLPAREDE